MSNPHQRRAAVVLVVEDEPVQRLALASLIEDGGFEVLEAWDADSAVAVLEERADVRLVVTDIEMPGAMDGMKLAAAVRDRWPPIEIILLSAGRPPRVDDLPARAQFVSKPIVSDRLLQKLKEIVH